MSIITSIINPPISNFIMKFAGMLSCAPEAISNSVFQNLFTTTSLSLGAWGGTAHILNTCTGSQTFSDALSTVAVISASSYLTDDSILVLSMTLLPTIFLHSVVMPWAKKVYTGYQDNMKKDTQIRLLVAQSRIRIIQQAIKHYGNTDMIADLYKLNRADVKKWHEIYCKKGKDGGEEGIKKLNGTLNDLIIV